MTIDEAIAHAREVAKEKRKTPISTVQEEIDFMKCAREHEQLAEWLEELKMYKSLAPIELVSEKQKNDRAIEYSKGFDCGFKEGYNKAVDDFVKIANTMQTVETEDGEIRPMWLEEIAEQLKEGGENE